MPILAGFTQAAQMVEPKVTNSNVQVPAKFGNFCPPLAEVHIFGICGAPHASKCLTWHGLKISTKFFDDWTDGCCVYSEEIFDSQHVLWMIL